jgi:hypothetical protein
MLNTEQIDKVQDISAQLVRSWILETAESIFDNCIFQGSNQLHQGVKRTPQADSSVALEITIMKNNK